MSYSHTIGEAMAYFRWKCLTGCCISYRCFACDIEWDALQDARTDEDVSK